MIWLFAVILLFFAGSAEATARYMSENGATSGTCTTTGTACRFDRVVAVAACGDTITILNGDGVYTGANNMLNFSAHPPAAPTCTLGNEITMQAETAGGVFFDGQFSLNPMWVLNMSYWKFLDFDIGNSDNTGSGSTVMFIQNSTHNEFKRIVASNVQLALTDFSEDVLVVIDSSNNLFEDMGLFGTAGNLVLEFNPGSTNNTYRRMWLRWEGHGEYTGFDGGPDNSDCGGPPFQIGYGAHQTSTYENIITVYQPDQVTASNGCYDDTTPGATQYGSALIRDSPFSGDHGYTLRGWIAYGKNTAHHTLYSGGNGAWFNQAGGGTDNGGAFAIDIVDFFVDALSLPNSTKGPIGLGCTSGACSGQIVNRITALRGTASSIYTNSGQYNTFTNINECTTAAACPNFYTGTVSSTLGARNCFRYVDGTLTSTPLWPWPMDDRIKAALARANAAGTGGAALDGTAGSGYAAATVTSEIVSRYGSVPTACLSSASFTPSFPVASDFPSVAVRDDFDRADSGSLGSGWTELLSDVFSIVSNAASAAPGGAAGAFARAIYSDTKLQTSHEVYATWNTIAVNGATTTFLSFAGTDLTANNQYRVRVTQSSSANTMMRVTRVDGAGTETTILSDVDLGIAAVDGNSFGVRVSGTTISIYWKWTDGIWYRTGQFTDSNLSTLPSTGVYGGIAGEKGSVIDNFGAGPFVDQPAQDPPVPQPSVGAGRFGTTFPGVR